VLLILDGIIQDVQRDCAVRVDHKKCVIGLKGVGKNTEKFPKMQRSLFARTNYDR
jgi:hypothetical protein